MSMGLNLTGTWKYREDFSYGDCEGVLELTHTDDNLNGTLVHTEKPLEGDSYKIRQILDGTVNFELMTFKLLAKSFSVLKTQEEIDYELDSFEAQLINDDLIVGTTEDKQGLMGVFSFKRILENK